jgi:hypothetical protein
MKGILDAKSNFGIGGFGLALGLCDGAAGDCRLLAEQGSESLEQALNETQNETSRDLLLQEALDAYNKTVEIDPQSVWACRKRAESCLS